MLIVHFQLPTLFLPFFKYFSRFSAGSASVALLMLLTVEGCERRSRAFPNGAIVSLNLRPSLNPSGVEDAVTVTKFDSGLILAPSTDAVMASSESSELVLERSHDFGRFFREIVPKPF